MVNQQLDYAERYENFNVRNCLICNKPIEKFNKRSRKKRTSRSPNAVTCCKEHSKIYTVIARKFQSKFAVLVKKLNEKEEEIEKLKEEIKKCKVKH